MAKERRDGGITRGAEAYGKCRSCRSGNQRTGANCSWAEENPAIAAMAGTPPCAYYQDYLRDNEAYEAYEARRAAFRRRLKYAGLALMAIAAFIAGLA